MTAALVLDEMFSPEIAAELNKRGHDVVAAALAGLPDDQILAWAAEQRRCLVTENVKDIEILRRRCVAQGIPTQASSTPAPGGFPRDRRFLGALVAALDQLLTAGPGPGPDEVSWLRPL